MGEQLNITSRNETGPGAQERARTFLGEQLLNIRRKIVASGEPLLSWEDLAREIAERRGEYDQRGR
jgi:hypothetical protein